MRTSVSSRLAPVAVLGAGPLFAPTPLAAVQNVFVKTYTPLLSAPSERTGKPLKNLAAAEVVRVVYTEEALAVTDLAQTWVRARVTSGGETTGWVFSGYLGDEPRAASQGPGSEPREDPAHIGSGSSK